MYLLQEYHRLLCLRRSRYFGEIDRVCKARDAVPRYHETVAEVPVLHFVKVSAPMQSVEIGTRAIEALDPFVSDNAGVGVAHEKLSQHLDAMIYRSYIRALFACKHILMRKTYPYESGPSRVSLRRYVPPCSGLYKRSFAESSVGAVTGSTKSIKRSHGLPNSVAGVCIRLWPCSRHHRFL
jgi:hypothetical protein